MTKEEKPELVFIVGASAGGLESISKLLENLNELENTCLIYCQHLNPKHNSSLTSLLKKHSAVLPETIKDKTVLKKGSLYIGPPNKDIILKDNKLFLRSPSKKNGPKPSIDRLLESAVEQLGNRVVSVILSGSGDDGKIGSTTLKTAGGIVMAQLPDSAKFSGMPGAVARTKKVDFIGKPNEIASELNSIDRIGLGWLEENAAKTADTFKKKHFRKILKVLSKRTDSDFSLYKESTIRRRLLMRMQKLGIEDLKAYLKYLEEDPTEIEEMFQTVLIGVTQFFRDRNQFNALKKCLTKYLEESKSKELRIWVAACSTGEEAYSMAILLHEILGKKITEYQIQIFASDIDNNAIKKARIGSYDQKSVSSLSKKMINTYFVQKNGRYEVKNYLKALILFSNHNLVSDPPFLKVDMISCRNLLIYFKLDLQLEALAIMHYALKEEGLLFLGKSEKPVRSTDLFGKIDPTNRIYFRKSGEKSKDLRLYHRTFLPKIKNQEQTVLPKNKQYRTALNDLVKETLFKSHENPFVVIDTELNIQKVFGDVRLFMSLPQGDMEVNLLKMLNPEFQLEVRNLLSKSITKEIAQKSEIKKFNLFDQEYYVRIQVKPVISKAVQTDYHLVIFEKLDIHDYIEARSNHEKGNSLKEKELRQELNETRENLQKYIEELETNNEELQSLNEEMQSTSEELQSSNEELETTNEELQSSNEEIEVAYSELKEANKILEKKEEELSAHRLENKALINNNLQASLLIDHKFEIKSFNEKAISLFKDLINKVLDVNFSLLDYLKPAELNPFVESIKQAVRGETINTEEQLINYKGESKWYRICFNPVATEVSGIKRISISLLDIQDLKILRSELNEQNYLKDTIFKVSDQGLSVIDAKGVIIDVNESYCKIFGYSKDELVGQHFNILIPEKDQVRREKNYQEVVKKQTNMEGQKNAKRKDGSTISVSVNSKSIEIKDKIYTVNSVKDISELKKFESQLINITNNLPGAIARYCLFENGQDSFIYFSSKSEKIWGIDSEKIVSDSKFFWQNIDLKERKRISEAFNNSLSEGKAFDLEFSLNRKKGDKHILKLSANPSDNFEKGIGQWDCIFLDITEEKKIQEELRERDFLFEQLLQSFHGVIVKYRKHKDGTGEVLYASPGIEKLQEIKREDALGRSTKLWDQLHPEDLQKVVDKVNNSASKLVDYSVDYRIITQKEEMKWLRANGKPYKVKDGAVEWDTFIWEITNEKEAELELERKNQELNRILNNSQDIICIANDQFRLIKVNPAASKILGYSEKEILSRPFTDFVHPDDLEKTKAEAINAVKDQPQERFENRYITKKGDVIWLEWISTVDKKNQLHFAIARDITGIKERQAQNEFAYEQAKLGTWSYDVKNDITYWSSNTKKIFGYKRTPKKLEQVLNMVKMGKHRNNHQKIVSDAIKEKKGWDFEAIYKTKDRGERWIRTIGRPKLKNGEVVSLFGTVQDVHERKVAELNLSELYSRQKNILDSISEAFYNLDKNWVITYWNKVAEKMSDKKSEDILGKKLWTIYPNSKWKKYFMEVKKTQKPISFEGFSEAWGIWCRVNINLTNEGYSVFIEDIDESVKYLNEIKTINERFELALEATKDAIFDWNVKENMIKWNNAIVELSGYPRAQIPSSIEKWLELIKVDNQAEVVKTLNSAIKDKSNDNWVTEFNATKRDGTENFVKIEGKIIRNSKGKMTRMVGAARDISEQRNFENRLKQLNQEYLNKAKELEASNEELEQFAYVASHDLQEPARMITSFMGLLKKNYGDQIQGKGEQYIEFAEEGGKRMRNMINDLLEYSRVGRKESKTQDVEMEGLIEEIKLLQKRLIEEKQAVIKYNKLPAIRAPKSILIQLFGNLINNALKYSKHDVPPEINIKFKKGKNHSEFLISDNGIGINPKFHEEIFQIFRKLKKKEVKDSTGLGLAIVKKIINQLQAKIRVESEEDQGTTFIIELPNSIIK